MARRVILTDTSPKIIEIGGEKKAICGCGLSANPPFCDGKHNATAGEEDGKTYQYNTDLERSEV